MGKGKGFAVKWKGRIYKILKVSKTSSTIVLIHPENKFSKTTYVISDNRYPSDSGTHWTIKNNQVNSKDVSEEKVDEFVTLSQKPGELHVYFHDKKPSIKNIKEFIYLCNIPMSFIKAFDAIPKDYEFVDLDKIGYATPVMSIYLTPPYEEKVRKIHLEGERRIMKFQDVWVVVIFSDVKNIISKFAKPNI